MPAPNAVVRDAYRRLLEAIYRRWAPEKLKNVSGLMQKYKGQEDEVYSKAVSMYVFSQEPQHWRPLIYGMYKRFNPSKLPTFEQVLEKYKNQEAQLYKALCTKYISALSTDDAPLEIYEWPDEDKPESSGANEASDSPQASECTPVARGEEQSSEVPTLPESVEESDAGCEASAGSGEPAEAGDAVARASSSRVPVLKTTRPKAGARAPASNGPAQSRDGSLRDEEARVFRGAAPKARRRAPDAGRAALSPEPTRPKGSFSENGSSHRRRVELLAARGADSLEQDHSPQRDAIGHKSHSAGHRRHSRGEGREKRGHVSLLPAEADGECARSRSRGDLTLRPPPEQQCDNRSRSRDAGQEPPGPNATQRHSRSTGTLAVEAAGGEQRATRDRRRRRHQQVQEEADAAARPSRTPPPLSRRRRKSRTGDETQRTDSGPLQEPLQAFVGAAPSNEGAGLPSELVEAEVEYRGEKICFLLSRDTTLRDVAEMYGSWVRAHGGVASQRAA
mmetsp:Transcript_153822/g.271468  ORF Transcript_153822/g.271468 Transcript_153822/m.271468 type:complete len:505 (+) Transcript_153822:31-1545(+)